MQTQYKYIIFCPYFGKLPKTFDLWVDSCKYNPQFLFIIFTDDDYKRTLPENVQIKHMLFQNLQAQVQSKFKFPISLKTPYKLCDFKPTYGYLFEEYLKNVEYWGYCDLDLVWGQLTKFLPNQPYDKISYLGHFCLYKNTHILREAFLLSSSSGITYKDILSTPTHFAFDENNEYGINAILIQHHMSIYPFEKHVADISSVHEPLILTSNRSVENMFHSNARIFSYENGHIYEHTLHHDKVIRKEYAYLHLQKRKMALNLTEFKTRFLITHSAFEDWQIITEKLIKKYYPSYCLIRNCIKHIQIRKKTFPRWLQRNWKIIQLKRQGNRE